MSPHASRTQVSLVVAAGLASLVLAQAAFAGPYDYDAKAARAGERATILLRIEAYFNDEPQQVYGSLFAPLLHVAAMDDRTAPEPVRLKAFGKIPGASDGWVALSLAPGNYFLLMQPTGWPLTPPSSGYEPRRNVMQRIVQVDGRPGVANLTAFWFAVPAGTPTLYVGTVVMRCRGEKKSSLSIKVEHCDDYAVLQEPDRAAVEGATLLPGGLAPVSVPLAPYGVPRGRPENPRDAKIALRIERAGGLTGATFTPAADVAGTVIVSNDPVTLLLGNLVTLVTEHAMQSRLDAQVAEKSANARACVDALAERMRGFDHFAALQAAFASQLSGRLDAGDGTPPTDSLAVSIERLQLRECRERSTLCVDLALHLRLADATSGAVRLDERLAYTSGYPDGVDPFKAGPRLYERSVAPYSRCTALADWCSTDGPQLLAEEIERGLGALAAQFVRDLDAAPLVTGLAP